MRQAAQLLKAARQRLGISSKNVAALMGIDGSDYSGYERANIRMSLARAVQFVQVLQMSPAEASKFIEAVSANQGGKQPASTSEKLSALLDLEMSRRGIVTGKKDKVRTSLSPNAAAKLQAMLPRIQERLTSKLNQLRDIGGSSAPMLGDTSFLVAIEHADGRLTFAWIELIAPA
jgi:transcriptional regulator with XRE-family HTH domain